MSSYPVSPNYSAGAVAQGAANAQAAHQTDVASRVNQNTPFGSQAWSYDPRTGGWTSNISLSPEQQQLLDAQNKQSLALSGAATKLAGGINTTPFSLGGVPKMASLNDFGTYKTSAYNDIMSRQRQEFGQQDDELRQRLINQGLSPGSEAWNRAYQPLSQSRVDASTQADLTSNTLGQQWVDAANKAHEMGVQDYITSRQEPLQELNALRQGSQVTTPQFSQYQGTNVQPMPIQQGQQLQGNYNLGQYGTTVAKSNNNLNGWLGLGGDILGSDWFSNWTKTW